MSNAAKTGIAIVILIIIIIIGWIWYNNSQSSVAPEPSPSASPAMAQQSPAASPVPIGPNLNGTGLSATNDASNASLQQDASALDTQISGLTTDTTNVDSGLSTGTAIPVQQ